MVNAHSIHALPPEGVDEVLVECVGVFFVHVDVVVTQLPAAVCKPICKIGVGESYVCKASALHTARLLRDKMKTNRKIYIEYHNEFWLQKSINGDTRNSTQYLRDMANANGLSNSGDSDFARARKYFTYRNTQIWDIFQQEFGMTDYNNRVRAVIGTQNANVGVSTQIKNDLNNTTTNPSNSFPWALSPAPYFGNGLNANASDIWTQIDNHIDDVIDKLKQTDETWGNTGGGRIACYEGGQHLTGNGSAALQKNWRMNNRYRWVYLPATAPYVQVFLHYTHAGPWTNGGNWGAIQRTGDTAGGADKRRKYDALKDYRNNG